MKTFYDVLFMAWFITTLLDLIYTLIVGVKKPNDLKVAIRCTWFDIIETYMIIAIGYMQLLLGLNNFISIWFSILYIITTIRSAKNVDRIQRKEEENNKNK